MVAGCHATGAADCEALIPRLWQQLLVKRGIKVPTHLDPPWASAHLAQLAVGLIPSSIQAYLPSSDWILPIILNDFAMGLAARLAEVLRRRESLLATADPPTSACASSAAPCASSVAAPRHVSVAEFRALEQAAPIVAPLVRPHAPARTRELVAHRRMAGLTLPEWIKQHRCLKACAMASGEPSVALLLLWEADHGTEFPSRAVDITGRLSTFTKRLKDAVAVDAELQRWLDWKPMPFSMVAGLPCSCPLGSTD